ncbi:MAG: type II toxin-antitoxin system PemK/MazF family toxin [Acidobacteriota bacterium]
MIQGDVCWHTFREPDKRRPVLILTNNELIPQLTQVTVAQITRTVRGSDSEVLLGTFDGMVDECAVNLTNIKTVEKSKISRAVITNLSRERMREVREAIEFVFDFDKLHSDAAE